MADESTPTVRLDPALRDAFLRAAADADEPVERALADLVRGYVKRGQEADGQAAFVAAKVERARAGRTRHAGHDGDAVRALFAERRAAADR